jgi:hypothetical protein
MSTKNPFPKPLGIVPVDYRRSVVMLGSCFSEHLGVRMRNAGFHVLSNPLGIVFHPVPLARSLKEAVFGNAEERILQRDDVWLSYDAASTVYALSEEELKQKLLAKQNALKTEIRGAGTLFITLGSAHGYRFRSTGTIVANCHKTPSVEFEKELTTLEDLVKEWSEVIGYLKAECTDLQIVFTVSPVRYSRDGWIENNRSKARLLELIGELQQQLGVGYFPAYELVNDILRDYRYFEADGVHPNQQAIDHVWDLFCSWYFDEQTSGIVNEMESLRKMESHRLLFPESVKSIEFRKQFEQKRESFLCRH